MSNENYSYRTITHYFEEDTGAYIDKCKLQDYDVYKLIDKTYQKNDRNYQIIITRIYACRLKQAIQLNLPL